MSDETVKHYSEAKALRAVLQMIARHSVTRPNAAMSMRLIAEGALETIKPEASDELAKARQERDELQREIELLKNPDAVHANMLRGTIAKPSIAQILHLYPELAITRTERTSPDGSS